MASVGFVAINGFGGGRWRILRSDRSAVCCKSSKEHIEKGVMRELVHLIRTGKEGEVVRRAESGALRLSASSYEKILTALRRMGAHEETEDMFELMRSSGALTTRSVNVLMKSLSERGKAQQSLQIFDCMEQEYGVTRDVASWAVRMDSVRVLGDAELAEKVFAEMMSSNIRMTAFICTASMKVFMAVKRYERAVQVFDQFCEQEGGVEDANVFVHAIRLDAMRHAKMVIDPDRELDLIRSHKVIPNAVIFCTLLQGCSERGDLASVLNIHDRMVREGEVRSPFFIAVYLEALYRLKALTRAESYLARIRPHEWSSGTVTIAVKITLATRGFRAALKTLSDIVFRDGYRVHSSVPFNLLVDASPSVKDARMVMRAMHKMRIRANKFTYGSLLKLVASEYGATQAKRVYSEAMKQGIESNEVLSATLADVCLRENDVEGAVLAMEEHVYPKDSYPIGIAMRVAARSGNGERFRALYSRLPKLMPIASKSTFYPITINMLAKGGLFEDADFLWKEAVKEPEVLSVVLYNTRIHSLILSKEVERARATMQEMVEKGFEPDEITYSSIFLAFSRAGLCDEARRILQTANENGFRLADSMAFIQSEELQLGQL